MEFGALKSSFFIKGDKVNMQRLPRKPLLALFALAATLTVTACGNEAAGVESPGNEPVKVLWWHAMGGESGKALDKLVADYNASQKKVQVEAVFQGNYDELLNKLKASLGGQEGPSMVQVNEVSSRFMADSKAIAPIQQFIDTDKFDISQLEPNIAGYYSFDNKLYSMPFNTSNPILYYNKDMFKAAGLDPEKAPQTFDEMYTAARAITKDGKTGASIAISGWFMEQFFAVQGAEYVNNGNGRKAPASQSYLNSEAGLKTLEWWKKMSDDKVSLNLGRKIADTKKAFLAGQVAMTIDSTAAMKGIIDGASGKFEAGAAFLPKPADANEGGVVLGGGSLYIMNQHTEAEQKAAWDFVKYLVAPEQQAYWHVSTGFFPVTVKAYEQESVKENIKKFPQFKVAIDQLRAAKQNTATQGAVMGVFADARQNVEDAIENVLAGKKSPKDALDSAKKDIDAKLELYNKTMNK